MLIVLENERPIGWNTYYAGKHWSFRKEEAERVHELFWEHIARHRGIKFNFPVQIVVTAYFKNRPLDPDNINAKMYIDGLKGWLLPDDTMDYVAGVKTVSKIDRLHPRVEIEVL